jgi:ATP:corrinoid adenosyltransferase
MSLAAFPPSVAIRCDSRARVGRGTASNSGPKLDMVIMDELNTALRYEYLSVAAVLDTAKARQPMQHVFITGRNAPPALAADLASEIRPTKHPYKDQA